MDKQCFKCKETKSLSEFYKHPKMGDGRLGKCVTCTKRDVAENIDKLKQDKLWLLKERTRCRLKARAARKAGKIKQPSKHKRRAALRKFRKNHPLKYKAHTLSGNAVQDGRLIRRPCEVCGDLESQKHHDDYSKPLQIRWLCRTHHNEHHVKVREQELLAQ